jgi:transposase-like protein
MTDRPRCPYCGSVETFRSHRRLLERLLLGFRPFRCRSCHSRFYAHQPAQTESQAQSEE